MLGVQGFGFRGYGVEFRRQVLPCGEGRGGRFFVFDGVNPTVGHAVVE